MLRILVADDREIVRQGLKKVLADEFARVSFGEAASGAEVIRRVQDDDAWDLVLLDLNMTGCSVLEVLGEVKRVRPRLPVLVLCRAAEEELATRALRLGAAGCLSKRSLGRELVAAVQRVLAGGRYLTPALAELLAARIGVSRPDSPHELLSNREYEVMRRIALGQTVKEIAAELSLSEKTVFTYRTRMLQKLDLRGSVEVARYALRHGLVE